MGRQRKFIIVENWKTNKVELRIGHPIFHRDLIDKTDEKNGWDCIGGGYWNVDFDNKEIHLYGSSDDFGIAPKKKIEESIRNVDDNQWCHISWVIERIFDKEHPEVDYDNIEKEFKFVID